MKKISSVLLLVLIITISISGIIFVNAAAPTSPKNNFGTSNADQAAGEIQKNVYQKLAGPALTLGGLAAFIGVVMCGFEMIFSKFNPDKRGSAMSSLLWIGGGLLIIGMAGIIAGFLLNMATV